MYRSIMVPLDESVFSEHALPLALSIARRSGAAVHLVQVHIIPGPLYDVTGLPSLDGRMDAEARERERSYLSGLARHLAATWNLTVTTALLDEAKPIADILHQHALASGVELIVMTTHGRGGVSRALLGSVADALVRQASMPVLLVRPHTEALDLLDLTREQGIKQMLIPLDGSALAEDILEPALDMGRLMHAECSLLRVVTPIAADDAIDALLIDPDEQLLAHRQAEARAYLDQVAERIRDAGLSVQTHVLVGPATETILAYSRQHQVDLIAMATHGRSGLARMFVGSVAEHVVRHAAVPVLLHRPSGMALPHAERSREQVV
jgi:nucleotide-binding universal stress UspA family protein